MSRRLRCHVSVPPQPTQALPTWSLSFPLRRPSLDAGSRPRSLPRTPDRSLLRGAHDAAQGAVVRAHLLEQLHITVRGLDGGDEKVEAAHVGCTFHLDALLAAFLNGGLEELGLLLLGVHGRLGLLALLLVPALVLAFGRRRRGRRAARRPGGGWWRLFVHLPCGVVAPGNEFGVLEPQLDLRGRRLRRV